MHRVPACCYYSQTPSAGRDTVYPHCECGLLLPASHLKWATLPVCPTSRGPDEIRTHNSLNANQVLYQLELRAHSDLL